MINEKEVKECGLGSADQMEKLLCFLKEQYIQKVVITREQIDSGASVRKLIKNPGAYSIYDERGLFYGLLVWNTNITGDISESVLFIGGSGKLSFGTSESGLYDLIDGSGALFENVINVKDFDSFTDLFNYVSIYGVAYTPNFSIDGTRYNGLWLKDLDYNNVVFIGNQKGVIGDLMIRAFNSNGVIFKNFEFHKYSSFSELVDTEAFKGDLQIKDLDIGSTNIEQYFTKVVNESVITLTPKNEVAHEHNLYRLSFTPTGATILQFAKGNNCPCDITLNTTATGGTLEIQTTGTYFHNTTSGMLVNSYLVIDGSTITFKGNLNSYTDKVIIL